MKIDKKIKEVHAYCILLNDNNYIPKPCILGKMWGLTNTFPPFGSYVPLSCKLIKQGVIIDNTW